MPRQNATMKFSETEKKILRMVQGDLPESLMPFQEIATACGTTEKAVLELLERLKEKGAIRRFGASIHHQEAGWKENAMVAWKATLEEACAAAPLALGNSRVSHMYYRPSTYPDWPYTFYTMIHGQTPEEVENTVRTLADAWKLPYAVLQSKKELKKTSPVYF